MKMLDAIDRDDGPTILGDGSEAFDFIAVEDCARANICGIKATVSDRCYVATMSEQASARAWPKSLNSFCN
jgi:UDP-glucose 4-epimerase